ncbi:hypothetical protein [Anabaena sp. UHCC 0204]|uniref:hypothetical protein n=1 Tax=Anabaena sp. UHCC 0204 TaxID=2590009 RepID=UPI0014457898|nr:hypothetical protein [Anabaena sp. UHCC 0204]MTJ08464.1 hypothetical protein [Anabaena sp. UHCC 0204]
MSNLFTAVTVEQQEIVTGGLFIPSVIVPPVYKFKGKNVFNNNSGNVIIATGQNSGTINYGVS